MDKIQKNNSKFNEVFEISGEELGGTPPIQVNNSVETLSLNGHKNSGKSKSMWYDDFS